MVTPAAVQRALQDPAPGVALRHPYAARRLPHRPLTAFGAMMALSSDAAQRRRRPEFVAFMSTASIGRPTHPHPLEDLLARAGVSRTSRIQITGESGLATLLWLLRRGYEDVTFVRSHGPTAAGAADVLLVAQTCDADRLEDLLEHGPHLAPDGVLIVQSLHGDPPRNDLCPRLLGAHGFSLERRVCGRRLDLHVARRADVSKAA